MTFPVFAGNSASTGYNLTRSLRTRASASAYLNRTPATTTNQKTWTWSGWIKRGTLGQSAGSTPYFFASSSAGTDAAFFACGFNGDALVVTGYATNYLTTSAVYRDPASWYHVVIAVDTTQATTSNRIKVYVNGSQITSFSIANYVAQNFNTPVNLNQAHYHCAFNVGSGATNFNDLYLEEVNFIDGQQLTPSSFGSTNALTGVWQPARYTGTYGTNGFYLPFTDNSALTTSSNVGLGKDFSGNGNYWTTNNISITAGTTYDSMTDVPTLTSATAANFAVLNPLNAETGMTGTLAGGNLNISGSGGKRSTIAARTGKFYWEFVSNSGAASNFPISGLYVAGLGTYWPGYDANSFGYFQGGDIYYNGSSVLTVSSFTDGDLLGFAWDADTGKVWVAKNNTWQNSGNPAAGTGQVTTISTGVDRVVGAYSSSGSSTINFGQRPFTYTPPTGFVALNTYNLPTSTILKGNTVMDATLWTGNSSTQSIVNAAPFKTDFVWIKNRTGANSHALFDSVRGVTKRLYSDATIDEQTEATTLTAFNSNGFSVSSSGAVNASANNYVGWQWQAGQGSTSSNTNGTITSTVSVNASAGFSVVTYTGTLTGTPSPMPTVGHGLGVAPSLVISKSRNVAGVDSGAWFVWTSAQATNNYLRLNTTAASASISGGGGGTMVAPTSSVFSTPYISGANINANTYVAYCWTPIAGYSAFGSYTGNGSSDGPFVYTGFRPKFVIVKMTSSTGDWYTFDSVRDPYNATAQGLLPNTSQAEATYTGWGDLLSNGFKIRRTDAAWNSSGGTYIYMVYAENPFRNSLAR